jgi:hypothetical protein
MCWTPTLERPVAQPLVGRSLVLYPDWQRADWQVMPLALIRGAQGEWLLLAEVTNRSRTPARLEAFYEGDTRSISVFLGSQFKPLQSNEPRTLTIRLPQEPTGTAEQKIGFQREPFGEIVWSARIEYRSHFLEWAHYGYRLKGAPAWAGLWWCEWGWKVGRTRELPRETREAVRLSAARGEYEPVQIVLRPTEPLRLLRAEPSDLRAGRHRIPARHITLREVAYVLVEYPTDTLGAIDDYPDPLAATADAADPCRRAEPTAVADGLCALRNPRGRLQGHTDPVHQSRRVDRPPGGHGLRL